MSVLIKFSNDEIIKCEKFSNEVDTSLYSKRNQTDNDKRILDTKIGKLGEIAAYHYLKLKYKDVSYPDFTILSSRQKSWDYDLKSTDFNFHVKSQNKDQSSRFGESWMFQLEDSHVFKKYSEKDYVVFVVVNIENNTALIKSIMSIDDLHKLQLFEKPRKKDLISNKATVYYKSLTKKLGSNIFSK